MLTVEATAVRDCVLMDQELTRWSRDEAIVQGDAQGFSGNSVGRRGGRRCIHAS
jgi:hypothetical protein